ncbi:hypothetical protein [Capnocytophaga catalasegens]|uniref:Uncharacterized protein n=1 Tax=Capnocytophaga catalasegens TaxID=1004260 RepID=A0AAV5ATN2_9FLAO|nr:hypothetical protein [Capnocytophaga catalasegens]GIZ15849.1 hypothetical protein RCZ03_18490 [Capnocytophaga catalasegens]GJM49216.1 hypothetical protein RCZ15_01910 [Capnocytophaga catalasegens]GJM53141.1 hypothetical protein RCZ16_14580 [Capnocytophaga catalasegens]
MKKIIITLCTIALFGNILISCKKEENNNLNTPPNNTAQPEATSFMTYALKTYDKNANGQLDDSEVGNIETLDLSNKGLTDLDGLEKFTNLETINVSKNNLTSVTLKNSLLNNINLSQNKLTKLDISNNTGLNYAQAKFDATNNPNLVCIKVNNNQLVFSKTYKDNWLKDDTASFNITCN